MSKPLKLDLTGQRYGRLLVLSRVSGEKRHVTWHCVCDCGNQVTAQTFSLIMGRVRSCGCYKSERMAERNRLRGSK